MTVAPDRVAGATTGPAPTAGPRAMRRLAAGTVFAAAVTAIAAIAAWPIYRSPSFLLLVGASSVLAACVATLAWGRRWGGWTVAGVLTAIFAVGGIPLAVPSRAGGFAEVLPGFRELASGALIGWKDLVTVELPVGSYRNLLVPAFIVFLLGPCLLLLLSWRADRAAFAAVPIALGMLAFGLFFGRSTVSAPLEIGPVTLFAPIEAALGAAGLVVCLLWLAWRTHEARRAALQRAAVTGGVRVSRGPTSADRRRTALAGGMIAAALLVAIAVVPFAARGADREVLRSAVGPDIDLSSEVSPLAQYRANFDGEAADDVLFTVTTSGGSLPERVRVATLDSYDGEVFRSGGAGAVDAGRFIRVPSLLDAGPGTPVAADIAVQGWSGIWMPTAGRLTTVDFSGDRAATLADRFYYNAAASAGVQTAGGGLRDGDRFTVRGVEPRPAALAEVAAPGGVSGGVAAPENLRTWVQEHVQGSGGAALAALVALLRERGYLSHGLTDDETSRAWMASLPGYSFQPSASGHSLARIDAMFERLLQRETDPRAEATENYVAAVGDDEQFAVATALIARELGFPARVVVGARLAAEPGLAACDEGVCRAQDLSAWTEVHTRDGQWIPIDVTPQFADSPSLDVTEQRDPENVTEVRPKSVEEVVPPAAIQDDSPADEPAADDSLDLAWLWPVVRSILVVLLILALAFGPFLVIIAAKAGRRRGRRRAGTATARIAGGWDEYVDAAVDAGRDAPRTLTRGELAASFATESGTVLATRADQAVFSDQGADADEAHDFWRIVDAERRRLAAERGVWRRLATTVSLRSFLRQPTPATGARPRIAERGRRRV